MPREDRRVTNIKQDAITEIDYYPSKQNVPEGELTIASPKGKPARLYKKLKGMLWWSNFTQDGNQYVDKNLNVDNDLIYKGYLRNSNYPAFSVYQGDSAIGQTIANNSRVRLIFDTETYDIGGNFDTSNYRFTAPVDGIYHFDIKLLWDNDKDPTAGDWSAEERHDIQIYKNDTQGATKSNVDDRIASNLKVISGTITDYFAMNHVSVDIKLDSGDYIEVVGYQNSGTNQYTYESNDPEWTSWSGHLITAI
tara:strand:- start:1202 stop:1954 length:753 start_codon:yes stop_codon:yes gene_type:complete